jgi:hypothetical protein
MASVYLAPCDPDSLDQTVVSPVDLSEYPDRPGHLEDISSARIWKLGVGEGHPSYVEKMAAGDLVLFYHDSTYIGVGSIDTTFEDTDDWASETFWDDGPAEILYTIDPYSSIAVDRAKVNRIFDYKPNYAPTGLTRVADNRISNSLAAIKLALEKASR